MKLRSRALALFLSLSLLIVLALAVPANAAADPLAADKVAVIITFARQPGADEQILVRALGGSIEHTYHIVRAMAATIPQAAVAALQRNPNVLMIEADTKATIVADTFPWGITKIGADIVHAGGNTGSGTGGSVKVAIIDTGMDYNHPDLAGRYAGGYDYVNNDSDPMDDNGHGTHVAGTIAAVYNDAGVVGVAPSVQIYALKVLDNAGSGDFSDVIAALEWCSDHGIQVTNNSYGSVLDPGQALQDAFNYTYYPDPQNPAKVDILHIAAAGNQGEELFFNKYVIYPAKYASVVAVSAINSNNTLASFSSAGAAVELAAPGVSIQSTIPGGGYAFYSGTSMASPHVAGTAALVIAAGITDNKPASVRSRLQSTADDLGAAGRDNSFGYGLVDADEAAGAVIPPDNQPPVVAIDSPVNESSYPVGAAITFSGTATDPEDGSLTSKLVWTSSLDGQIGTGGSFSTATLRAGTHAITAAVTDSGGKTTSSAITITVDPVIVVPANVYVALVDYRLEGGKTGTANLVITVTLQDDLGAAVTGTAVTVNVLRGSTTALRSTATTGSTGQAVFRIKNAKAGTYRTTVTKIVSSLIWDGVTPANVFTKY